ncbi:hypothetical protein PVAG01_06439 [Phlyctema vagabunda]|uniref:T6SS Phospholipase effector Tle1-like catalytic domain-containing protein n=1 Tax=Phlyctema vagabunda TaxID=108571 RepID=A0ABR4PG26_9HELO
MNDSTKPWDEIILLGFSRGAFTARAISSLIHDVGLLTKEGLEFFFGIIEDWKNQNVPGMEWKWYQAKFGKVNKKTFGWTQYKETLVKSNLTRSGMSVRAVGVFDTVGALGIPAGIWDDGVREYSFVNTKVSQSIEYAFHALALDEHRTLFAPTVWEHPDAPHKLKQLKQCWFAGVHSNIGGGYPDAGSSNITLAWMMSQLEHNKILEFDPDYKDFVQDLNKDFYARVPKPRPWALGRVYDSTAGLVGVFENAIKPPRIRTPGNCHRIDAATGKETKVPLEKTGECMHRSVRVRVEQGGLGEEPDTTSASALEKIGNGLERILGKKVETYAKQVFQGDLAPLKGFALAPPTVPSPQSSDISALGSSGYGWKFGDRNLPEDEFLDTERKFLLRHKTFAA